MIGIIEEQHPDRAGLFMQWKQMGWPILVDSLNLLKVSSVPITLAIDENGIIRFVGLRVNDAATIERRFVDQQYETPTRPLPPKPKIPSLNALRDAAGRGNREYLDSYADALFLWGGVERLEEVIGAYERSAQLQPSDGWTQFRLGVAYRRRYDSPYRNQGDFEKAVEHWSAALAIDPNQYIWRRRIQQYGPRLDKPYPFYDWVEIARKEVSARREIPAPLSVEPTGSELTKPSKAFASTGESPKDPDPDRRITLDSGQFVRVEAVVVPDTTARGVSVRVHLIFRPNVEKKVHWNNEAGAMGLWVSPPAGWQVDSRYQSWPSPPLATSQEIRELEFEVRVPDVTGLGPFLLPAYALYYICEDVDGVCMYRRQDVPISISLNQNR